MKVMQALDNADLNMSDSDVLLSVFAKTFNVPDATLDMLRTQINTVIELNSTNEEQVMKRVA